MNKIPCEVIKDLFPSYIDGLTSDKTNDAIGEHIASCSDCAKSLKLMRGDTANEMLPGEDDKKEISFLKKTKRMQNIAFFSSLAAVVLCALAVLIRLFIVGTSYDGAYYMIDELSVRNGIVNIKAGTADSSANVISRMKFTEADGVLAIKANQVPVSIFCRAGKEFSYSLKQPESLKTIKIGSQIIWEENCRISPLASAVYQTKHPYVGDMSANGKTARAINAYTLLGEYENELQTSQEPYGWTLRLKNDIAPENEVLLESDMESIAYVLIAMTGNLDHVSYEYTVAGEAHSLTFDAGDATAFLGRDIKDCSGSVRILDELIGKTGL